MLQYNPYNQMKKANAEIEKWKKAYESAMGCLDEDEYFLCPFCFEVRTNDEGYYAEGDVPCGCEHCADENKLCLK